MAIDQPSSVDVISLGNDNSVLLLISDHLEWNDVVPHLYLLQEKVNTYCQYIESGQLYNDIPQARDRRPIIEHVFFHPPPAEVLSKFQRLEQLLNERKILFRSRAYGDKSEFTPNE